VGRVRVESAWLRPLSALSPCHQQRHEEGAGPRARRCARGSLYDVLQKAAKVPALAPQLDWPRRLNIALDAAKARRRRARR
jgi:hypothetical protein